MKTTDEIGLRLFGSSEADSVLPVEILCTAYLKSEAVFGSSFGMGTIGTMLRTVQLHAAAHELGLFSARVAQLSDS